MLKKRTLTFYAAIILVFIALMTRLFFIMKADSGLTVLATGRRYSVKLAMQRGEIFDRNGNSLLGEEEEAYAVCVPPLEGGSYAVSRLAEAGNKTERQIASLIEGGVPFALKVNDCDLRLDNVDILTLPRRAASNGVAAHIIGYTDSDGNGICGIEKAFNEYLASSESINASLSIAARSGALTDASVSNSGNGRLQSVTLTIDKGISRACRNAFEAIEENIRGAVVVMDVSSGDILAGESFPSYNPNSIASSLTDANAPLLNRAFTAFNIGSAFKIITAAAILENGLADSTCSCPGYIHVGGRDISCHNESGHGMQGLTEGFANSCNPYFISTAIKVGADALLDTASRFGIGRAYKLADGISTDSGTLTARSSLSSSLAIANFSIGQGDLMVTPIQAAIMVSAVANGGSLVTPRLVSAISDEDGDVCESFDSTEPTRIISAEIAAELQRLMIHTVESGTGTAAKPSIGGAGGKTATAQTGSFVNGVRINNTWFVGFYPAESPKYAIVVLCENGSSGSRNAAPVFRTICEYLSR